jgi:hypothetical protein
LEKEKIDQNEYLPATKMSVTALAISSIWRSPYPERSPLFEHPFLNHTFYVGYLNTVFRALP